MTVTGDIQYLPIPINRFLCGESAPMDLYLKLADKRYIKVVKAGDYFNRDRLRNYKDKSVDTIYVTSLEFPVYTDACLSLLRAMTKTLKPGAEHDIGLTLQVAEVVFTSLNLDGISDDNIEKVAALGSILSDQIKLKPKVGGFVNQLLESDNAVSRHAVSVSMICLMILHNLRWQLKRNVDAILIGALLHDISLIDHPNVYEAKDVDWSKETQEIYADHAFNGAQMLLDAGVLSDRRVADIIRDHHELPSGNGFPNGLQGNQIFPMALPLIMADRLTHLLLDPHSSLAEKTFPRAVRYLKSREESFYPESYWKALESWEP